jgi:fused signal recognition particle receptor
MLGLMRHLKEKLAKTKNSFVGRIAEMVKLRGKVDEALMDDLEEALLQSDVGADLSFELIERLREEVRLHKLEDAGDVQSHLEAILREILLADYEQGQNRLTIEGHRPFVILFVGVNGVGKTTTIGKLARRFHDEGKSVMLIAGDTFRAAAIEQLGIWAERADVTIVRKDPGADPSSVVFDGLTAAVSRNTDIVLIDTAGRQHTKVNLMNELEKIGRTIRKVIPDAPHETMLVVDATTGQNALTQTKMFNQVVPLSGIALTKLDGTAKGGIVLGIQHQMKVPVKLIGVGETVEDLRDFDPGDFIAALFEPDQND